MAPPCACNVGTCRLADKERENIVMTTKSSSEAAEREFRLPNVDGFEESAGVSIDLSTMDEHKGKSKTYEAGAVHELSVETSASSGVASSLGTSASAAGGHEGWPCGPQAREERAQHARAMLAVITTQPYCEESEIEGGYIFALTSRENEEALEREEREEEEREEREERIVEQAFIMAVQARATQARTTMARS